MDLSTKFETVRMGRETAVHAVKHIRPSLSVPEDGPSVYDLILAVLFPPAQMDPS